MLTTKTLVGYQVAQFNRATRLATVQMVLQLGVALPAAASVFVESEAIMTYSLAVAGVLLLLLYVWIDLRCRRHQEAGQRTRRALLVMEGLGERLSPDVELELRNAFTVTAAAAAKCELANYYASKSPPGPRRLAEIIEESAFWTSRLQRASGVLMLAVFGVILLTLLVCGAFALPFVKGSATLIVARIILVLLTFILSADALGSVLGHFRAAEETESIRRRMVGLLAKETHAADVMLAMADYNSAAEAAPQHVLGLYKAMRSHLNELWSSYIQSREEASR